MFIKNDNDFKYIRCCINCFKMVEIKPNKKYYVYDDFHFVCSKKCFYSVLNRKCGD